MNRNSVINNPGEGSASLVGWVGRVCVFCVTVLTKIHKLVDPTIIYNNICMNIITFVAILGQARQTSKITVSFIHVFAGL